MRAHAVAAAHFLVADSNEAYGRLLSRRDPSAARVDESLQKLPQQFNVRCIIYWKETTQPQLQDFVSKPLLHLHTLPSSRWERALSSHQ